MVMLVAVNALRHADGGVGVVEGESNDRNFGMNDQLHTASSLMPESRAGASDAQREPEQAMHALGCRDVVVEDRQRSGASPVKLTSAEQRGSAAIEGQ